MEFKDLLNNYIEKISVSAKELSDICNIDATLISRYRTGKRIPAVNSQSLITLSNAIEAIAKEKNIELKDDVLSSFNSILSLDEDKIIIFTERFDEIIKAFHINVKKLANYLNYDVSYLYRIRNGERKPQDLDEFIHQLVIYLLENINNKELKQYINASSEHLEVDLKNWLISKNKEKTVDVLPFLTKIDEFDLDDYMQAIHFNELKIPHIPFQLPSNKYYYGIKEMRNAELDFFKYTVLNKSDESIFMYSTMPIEDMAEDMDFNKKWMFGLAMSLKKGLRINIIHHLDRPFNELMLGLEAWIPIYMTGLVNPYYMPNFNTDIFHSINYVSGNIMLHGECVDGHYKEGRYFVSTNKNDVKYAKATAKGLLDKAKPLMSIYDTSKKEAYHSYLNKQDNMSFKTRVDLGSTLPLETIDENLLLKILERNKVDTEKKRCILEYYHHVKNNFYKNMDKMNYKLCFTMPDEENYIEHPIYLDVAALFLEDTIVYSYEELLEHYKHILSLESQSFRIVNNDDYAFININISIIDNHNVIVSKIKSPVIHFVIEHPILVDAISRMITLKRD